MPGEARRGTGLVRLEFLAAIALGAMVLASCSQPDDVDQVPWSDYEVVGETSLRFTIPDEQYHSDSCYAFEPDVEMRRDEVRVTLRYRRIEEFCTLEGALPPVQVVVGLPEPLSGRPVVDGSG